MCVERGWELLQYARSKSFVVDVGGRFAQLSIQPIFLFYLVHVTQTSMLPASVSISLVPLTRLSSPCQAEYPTPERPPHGKVHFGSKVKPPNARATEANSTHA